MMEKIFLWKREIDQYPTFRWKRVLMEKGKENFWRIRVPCLMPDIPYIPNDFVVSLFSSLSAQNILHTITPKYIYIIYTYNISSIIS